MPGTLPELRQQANTHYPGDPSRQRLFHLGHEMQHPAAVANLQDGDTVLVRPHRTVKAKAPERLLTTHQADYVRHRPQTPTEPTMTDDASTLTEQTQGKRMDGRTVYADDYTPKKAGDEPPHGNMGKMADYESTLLRHAPVADPKSAYRDHYPWKFQDKPAAIGSDGASVLSNAALGHPFSARTNYTDEYTPRGRPVRPSNKDLPHKNQSVLTKVAAQQPWLADGTCYKNHYIPQGRGRQPSAHPGYSTSIATPGQKPFTGDSEYGYRYKPPGKEQSPIVHLQHEDDVVH